MAGLIFAGSLCAPAYISGPDEEGRFE